MNDDELIALVADGSDTALRELFSRHAPWLAGRLRAALPASDVEDVLQETFLALWRGAKRYRADGAAGAWLWGIARRQAAMWLRRRGRDVSLLDTLTTAHERDEADTSANPADAVASRVDLAGAVAALGAPGAPDREVWRLLYVEDRPVAEVASLMGVPEGTVKSRAHRARRVLRAALGGHVAGGDPS
jgi:RNA polymerase sigma-70 factor (ECF subfamily)